VPPLPPGQGPVHELRPRPLCGTEWAAPVLIVDGRFSHAGDFLIPGLPYSFYIAGRFGWARAALT